MDPPAENAAALPGWPGGEPRPPSRCRVSHPVYGGRQRTRFGRTIVTRRAAQRQKTERTLGSSSVHPLLIGASVLIAGHQRQRVISPRPPRAPRSAGCEPPRKVVGSQEKTYEEPHIARAPVR